MRLTNVELWLQFLHLSSEGCKLIHGEQGVGVVVAQYPPVAGQGLLKQLAGALEVAKGVAGRGEVVHRAKGVGVVAA
jgi:hypothetical protein